jgi:hypothetical protein
MMHADVLLLQLVEVVLDVGRLPVARFPSGDSKLACEVLSYADIDGIVAQVTASSPQGVVSCSSSRTHLLFCRLDYASVTLCVDTAVGWAVAGRRVWRRQPRGDRPLPAPHQLHEEPSGADHRADVSCGAGGARYR